MAAWVVSVRDTSERRPLRRQQYDASVEDGSQEVLAGNDLLTVGRWLAAAAQMSILASIPRSCCAWVVRRPALYWRHLTSDHQSCIAQAPSNCCCCCCRQRHVNQTNLKSLPMSYEDKNATKLLSGEKNACEKKRARNSAKAVVIKLCQD